jgi:hypothetical protein
MLLHVGESVKKRLSAVREAAVVIGGDSVPAVWKRGRFAGEWPNRGRMSRGDACARVRDRAAGTGTWGRSKCNSPRSSSSHCTVSPGARPMAAAKASGKLT